MAIDLNGKVCVITGADEGLGYGLALGFLARGARVAAGVLNSPSLPGLESALVVPMDVTNESQVAAAIDRIIQTFGRIDVLVNNAGVYPRLAADAMSRSEWHRVLDINLHGSWHCANAVIPHMKASGGGSIINVGSVSLRLGTPHQAHYHASKGGVVGLTRGLARDLGRYGIRVNCLHPGAILTDGERRLFPDEEVTLREMNQRQSIPGRLTPESLEPTFAFFASSESAPITGQCLNVDNGWAHD
jgi:NAD(P)-dependent dehydrogenase (short-subunit alcohol dehydrogenase family)